MGHLEAIQLIAKDGVGRVCQVHPDLVRPPSPRGTGHQHRLPAGVPFQKLFVLFTLSIFVSLSVGLALQMPHFLY